MSSEKDKIIAKVYFDEAGYGSVATTLADAKKYDYDYIIVQLLEYFKDVMYPCKYCCRIRRGYKTLEKLKNIMNISIKFSN